jgi:hypothetical protein
MTSNKQQIIEKITRNADWDLWRTNHSILTFEDNRNIYDAIFPKCQVQRFHDTDFFLECFRLLQKFGTKPEFLKIAELGSYTGILAAECMEKYEFDNWTGYEISKWAVDNTVKEAKDREFKNVMLLDEFWKSKTEPFNTFVSSDTIEHLTDTQAKSLFDFVSRSAKFLILQIDTKSKGLSWKGYGGSHILEMTIEEVVQYLYTKGYKFLMRRQEIGPFPGVRIFMIKAQIYLQ